MKTPSTASSAFVKTALPIVTVLLLVIAGFTYGLALTGDTTALGDPYYEDKILAPDRAFAPWALMVIASGIVVLAKVMQWLKR